MIWLGVDVGSARIGLARSVGSLAMPMEAVPAGEGSAAAVAAVAAETHAAEIVIGLPLRMDGTEGPAAAAARAWAGELARVCPLPQRFVDERLTTKQAQRGLHAAGRDTRASRPVIDSASAVVLLQSCLDRER